MRRAGTVLAITTALVTAVLLVLSALAVWTVRRTFPDYGQDVDMAGLVGEVEILRDAYGVPTIWADTAEDLFRAQGYVHAQDRFWEMDVRRHLTAGRLSELFGESEVTSDTFLRTLGWRRVAEAEVPLLSPQSRRYFEAYAAGVNVYLAGRTGGDLALPYTILGLRGLDYVPEPWTAADSLAWFKAIAWDLRHNIKEEIERAVLSAALPPSRVAELFPDFPYDRQGTILDQQDLTLGLGGASRGSSAGTAAASTQPSGGGGGSNSWVVGPGRTRSGQALLANDPHLAPSLPSVWTQVGLRCRKVSAACPFDVQGFSFSGVPGVIIGHNRQVAWGFTSAYADTMDLYLEKVEGGNYLTEEGMLPLDVRTETIRVAGGPDVSILVRSTRHGPLLSDANETFRQVGLDAPVRPSGRNGSGSTPGSDVVPRGNGYAVALRWTALQPGYTGDAIFAMARANGWRELIAATELFDAPAQNVVFADAQGTIGYALGGAVPRRAGYTGRDVVEGWSGTNDWRGMLTAAQKPGVVDPPRGFLVTANEEAVPADYPYLITSDPNPAYRGDRLRELLAENPQMDNAASARFATDTWSGLAEYLVPVLLDVPALTGYYADGQRLLADWDYSAPADSAAAAYFSSAWSNLLRLTFHDDLPAEYWPDGGGRWFEVVRRMLDDPLNAYWDDVTTDTVVETRDEILDQAMRAARDDCTRRMGKDPDTWQWGRLHELRLKETTLGASGVPLIERIFNRGPYPVGGGSSLVLANSWDASDGFDVTAVPTMRMQVDFGDLDSSRWVQLTGQSGHPYHPSYTDQVGLWSNGSSTPMLWSDEARRKAAVHSMTLRPQAPE